jgi:hypothetical protein
VRDNQFCPSPAQHSKDAVTNEDKCFEGSIHIKRGYAKSYDPSRPLWPNFCNARFLSDMRDRHGGVFILFSRDSMSHGTGMQRPWALMMHIRISTRRNFSFSELDNTHIRSSTAFLIINSTHRSRVVTPRLNSSPYQQMHKWTRNTAEYPGYPRTEMQVKRDAVKLATMELESLCRYQGLKTSHSRLSVDHSRAGS